MMGMLQVINEQGYGKKRPINNKTVFHLLFVATSDGSVCHLVDRYKRTKDGHMAYQNLVTCYGGNELIKKNQGRER